MGEYWLVDPREQCISVWSLEQGKYNELGKFMAGNTLQTRILPGLEIDPAEIF